MNFVVRSFPRSFLLVGSFVIAASALAETGVSPKEIVVGSIGQITGSARQYGEGMMNGNRAYFEKLNAAGGVNGRKITPLFRDDDYDPAQAIKAAEKLVTTDQIFAAVGGSGSATQKVVLPVFTKSEVPVFFPYTGAEFLRDPKLKWVFNLRASYFQENADLVELIVKKLGKKDFGIFYQNDALGETGRDAVRKHLEKYGFTIGRSATFARNAPDKIQEGLESLLQTKPSVIFLEGISEPCANFIREAAKRGYHPIYAGPSPLGSQRMAELLEGVDRYELYVSEVMPSPTDRSKALVRDYQDAMKQIGQTKLGFISLEGFAGAKVFAEAVRRAGTDVTRAGVAHALESMSDFDLGGLKVSFSPTQHQGLQNAFVIKVKDGKLEPIAK